MHYFFIPTQGVSGIGLVNAMEVVLAFPGMEGLKAFKQWVESPDALLVGLAAQKFGGGTQQNQAGEETGVCVCVRARTCLSIYIIMSVQVPFLAHASPVFVKLLANISFFECSISVLKASVKSHVLRFLFLYACVHI